MGQLILHFARDVLIGERIQVPGRLSPRSRERCDDIALLTAIEIEQNGGGSRPDRRPRVVRLSTFELSGPRPLANRSQAAFRRPPSRMNQAGNGIGLRKSRRPRARASSATTTNGAAEGWRAHAASPTGPAYVLASGTLAPWPPAAGYLNTRTRTTAVVERLVTSAAPRMSGHIPALVTDPTRVLSPIPAGPTRMNATRVSFVTVATSVTSCP